ncbi:hypothetical protein C5167_043707 [Papaver somniferum]|uniref:Uncharacterized protein n=1 Tax=Papaver somniferum TaxID=3469 RepID=A0A4Y7LAE7_PAPSO|nr:hypothetical protein C5167_043707 [Papaver somniferum]
MEVEDGGGSECELKFGIGETEKCNRNWLLVLVVIVIMMDQWWRVLAVLHSEAKLKIGRISDNCCWR